MLNNVKMREKFMYVLYDIKMGEIYVLNVVKMREKFKYV